MPTTFEEFVELLRKSDPDKALIIEQLHSESPPYFQRSDAPFFKAGSLANIDSRGAGCPVRIRRGSKIYYPRDAYLVWVSDKIQAERTERTGD